MTCWEFSARHYIGGALRYATISSRTAVCVIESTLMLSWAARGIGPRSGFQLIDAFAGDGIDVQ